MKQRTSARLIDVSPDICHGQPCFTGTRIQLWVVLELLEAGVSTEEILSSKYFPQLTPAHIKAALHLAAEQFKSREFVAFSPR